MIKQFCVFPFLQIEEELYILGLTIQPGNEINLQKIDKGTVDIFSKVKEKIEQVVGTIDHYSIILLDNNNTYKQNIKLLRNVADFLRFRLSYDDEEFDYDQALFIVVTDDREDSIKLSINLTSL